MSSKEGFVIYKSFYEPIKDLPDEQLGSLFRSLFLYQIDGTIDVKPELQMAFAFFKNQMNIDDRKYQKVVDRNKSNGAKGGRPKIENNIPENPVGYKKPSEPKKADKEKEKEKDKDKDKEPTKELGITIGKVFHPLQEIKEKFSSDAGIPIHWVNHGNKLEELDVGVGVWVTQNLLENYQTYNAARKHFIFWIPNYYKYKPVKTLNSQNGLAKTLEILNSGS